MKALTFVSVLSVLSALSVAAPQAASAQGTVKPGMTRAEVITAWGEPYAERTRGAYTYMSFKSDCLPACGTHDVVTLKDGKVIDAIARSSNHKYDGTSSVQRTPGFTDSNGVTTPVPPPSGTP